MKDLVFKSEKGNAVTTSLLVAQKFGKRHVEVLDAIRNLTKVENYTFVDNQEVTDTYKRLNKMFYNSTQSVPMPVGGGFKETPIIIMNRDGFSLLVMGFTGKDALAFKISFIEAFNKMEQDLKSQLPQSFAEALQLAANQAREIEEQQKQLAIQAPKVLLADAVTASSNSVLIAELSRILKQNGLNIGQNRLFERLRQEGYLLSKGEYYNLPSQSAMDLKIFEIKETPIVTKNGSQIKRTVMVTAKGLDYFVKKYVVKG